MLGSPCVRYAERSNHLNPTATAELADKRRGRVPAAMPRTYHQVRRKGGVVEPI